MRDPASMNEVESDRRTSQLQPQAASTGTHLHMCPQTWTYMHIPHIQIWRKMLFHEIRSKKNKKLAIKSFVLSINIISLYTLSSFIYDTATIKPLWIYLFEFYRSSFILCEFFLGLQKNILLLSKLKILNKTLLAGSYLEP